MHRMSSLFFCLFLLSWRTSLVKIFVDDAQWCSNHQCRKGKVLDEGALLQVIEERNVFAALECLALNRWRNLAHCYMPKISYNAAYCGRHR